MPRLGYAKATKAAILKAVLDVRNAGMKWVDAHKAAVKAGYKGSIGGIVQMLRNSKKQSRKRRRGMRKRASNATVNAPSNPIQNVDDIALGIEKLVRARVNEAIARAVDLLGKARQ